MPITNADIIEEFRTNAGVVGGYFEGMQMLLLHSTGAKSGKPRINPMVYRTLDDGSYAVFASFAGSPRNPDWYYNLVAHPDVSIEVGTENVDVSARVLDGAEREVVWAATKTEMPTFAEYEQKAGREIPVIALATRS